MREREGRIRTVTLRDIGDDVLIEVASRITAALRPGDFVAQIGEDSPWQPGDLADRIERAVCSIFSIGSADVAVSVSVGVAVLLPGYPVEAARRDADARMYDIKQLRRALAQPVG